jgi:hypothetical protein
VTNVTAVISMLHEPAGRNSATRRFRHEPVLRWTLDRVTRARNIDNVAILCWEDQLDAVQIHAEASGAYIMTKGPRIVLPTVEAIAAAQRWADGWRGGLLSTCDFDQGFYAKWIDELATRMEADTIVLVDPSVGMIDPQLIDEAIKHARSRPALELCFAPAAPGLAATVIRSELVKQLATNNGHPGRLLHYMPEQPCRDPLGGEGCAAVPAPVARTTARFKLDSDRQIERLSAAWVSLNGQLIGTGAEELVHRVAAHRQLDQLPREVVLELTPRRATSPIFSPLRSMQLDREEMTLERAAALFDELATMDDMRLTLAGIGDSLLATQFEAIVRAAKTAGIAAIHVETDLLPPSQEMLATLIELEIDVISVHLPAIQPATYAAVMNVDRMAEVIENIRALVALRHRAGRGVPLVVPVFTKCAANLAEMEQWYDTWLRAVGSAVVAGPSDFAGQITGAAVADMAPPRRRACARLQRRLMVLSDGRVVACEQDIRGRHALGRVGEAPIAEIWRQRMSPLRADHAAGQWNKHQLCTACTEWHRP